MNPPAAAFCLNCAASLTPAPPVVGGQPNQQWVQPNIGGPQPASGGTSTRAVVALCLAIAGLVCCGPFTGLPAAIVGWLELDSIKKGQSSADGKVMALIGLWGGIAVTLLHGIGYVLYFLFAMMAASNPYAYPY